MEGIILSPGNKRKSLAAGELPTGCCVAVRQTWNRRHVRRTTRWNRTSFATSLRASVGSTAAGSQGGYLRANARKTTRLVSRERLRLGENRERRLGQRSTAASKASQMRGRSKFLRVQTVALSAAFAGFESHRKLRSSTIPGKSTGPIVGTSPYAPKNYDASAQSRYYSGCLQRTVAKP